MTMMMLIIVHFRSVPVVPPPNSYPLSTFVPWWTAPPPPLTLFTTKAKLMALEITATIKSCVSFFLGATDWHIIHSFDNNNQLPRPQPRPLTLLFVSSAVIIIGRQQQLIIIFLSFSLIYTQRSPTEYLERQFVLINITRKYRSRKAKRDNNWGTWPEQCTISYFYHRSSRVEMEINRLLLYYKSDTSTRPHSAVLDVQWTTNAVLGCASYWDLLLFLSLIDGLIIMQTFELQLH